MLKILFKPEILILLEFTFICGLGLFFLIARDFTSGIYLWLVSLVFFKYVRLNVAHSMLPDISIDRILFVILISIFVIEVFAKKRPLCSFSKVEYFMFLFCLLAVISMVCSGFIVKEEGRLRIGELLTGYIFPFSMFFIARNIYRTSYKIEGFVKFIMFIGLYLSFTAFFEHFGIHSLVWPRYILDPYFGIHFGRARGPFGQSAVNGTILGIALCCAFYFLLNQGSKAIWKIFSYALLTLTPFALLFTYTRAPWLGALLGFFVIMFFIIRHKKKAFAVIAVMLGIIVFFAIFCLLDDDTTAFAINRIQSEKPVYDRLNLYGATVNMFLSHPLFGVGFGRFSDLIPTYFKNIYGMPALRTNLSEHDTFASIVAEMGLVGFGLILSIYFLILSASTRLYRKLILFNKEQGVNLVVIFWASTMVFIINSIFIEMRYFEFVNSLFFIFAGIVYEQNRLYL